MKFRLARLGDICLMRTGKLNSNAAVDEGAYPFFTCAREVYRINEYAFETEAVLLGGNNANGVFPLKYYNGRFNAYQRTYVIEPKSPGELKTRYLYYALRPALSQFKRISIGATTQYLTKGILDNFKIKVYDADTQTRIADILSAYDDLIENNLRRIALLKRAARELYREWFVRLRFPGYGKTKIVDGTPEGWERKTLGDVLSSLESGGRPKGGAQEEGIPSIGAENVTGIGEYDFTKEKYVPEEYFNAMRKGVVRNRDVVVYKDGANIGRSSYFGDGYPHEKCAINEHVFILRSLPEVGQNYLYSWVAEGETRQRIANLNANTAQPGISQGKLKTLGFVQPPSAVVGRFNKEVESTVRQIFLLARSNQRLTEARDLLLPRLMSGELTARRAP